MAKHLICLPTRNWKRAPPFLAPEEDTAIKKKSLKEEKIARMCWFYALECGIGWLCSQSNQAPARMA